MAPSIGKPLEFVTAHQVSNSVAISLFFVHILFDIKEILLCFDF
jgi:hypothetical protein